MSDEEEGQQSRRRAPSCIFFFLSCCCKKMRAFALSLVSSGGFLKGTLTVYTEEMSTTASPTIPSSLLTPDQLTMVAASFSSLVFFVVIVVLLSIIYHKDPQCCKRRSYQGPHADMKLYLPTAEMSLSTKDNCSNDGVKLQATVQDEDEVKRKQSAEDAPPQYYSSRQTLVESLCQTDILDDDNTQQAGQLFYVGLPSSYSLPTLEAPLPRLPSYESVRKKDRQRQIHMMIADRFGLNGPIVTEPPPTYEETIRQSVALPYDILSPGLVFPLPQSVHTHTDTPHPVSPDTNDTVLPV